MPLGKRRKSQGRKNENALIVGAEIKNQIGKSKKQNYDCRQEVLG